MLTLISSLTLTFVSEKKVLPDSSIQERKSQAKELWMRVLQRGSLLCFETEWWITTGWNGHCNGHLLQRKHQWKDKGR